MGTLPFVGTVMAKKKAKKIVQKARRGYWTSGAKLTHMEVREIRWLHDKGEHTYGQLAEQFEVSAQAIRNIILKFSWKDLPDE